MATLLTVEATPDLVYVQFVGFRLVQSLYLNKVLFNKFFRF